MSRVKTKLVQFWNPSRLTYLAVGLFVLAGVTLFIVRLGLLPANCPAHAQSPEDILQNNYEVVRGVTCVANENDVVTAGVFGGDTNFMALSANAVACLFDTKGCTAMIVDKHNNVSLSRTCINEIGENGVRPCDGSDVYFVLPNKSQGTVVKFK